MPGHTITGAIKLHNTHLVTTEEMEALLEEFNRINDNRLPKPGNNFKIPILDRLA
jgi:hypothetical protein